MNQDYLFTNGEDDEPGDTKKTPGISRGDTTPEVELNRRLSEIVSEYATVVQMKQPYHVSLIIDDAENHAAKTNPKYSLYHVGLHANEIADERMYPIFSILNDLIPRLSILRQMLYRSHSVTTGHQEIYAPRLQAILSDSIASRMYMQKAMDGLNEFAFTMSHLFDYENDLIFAEEVSNEDSEPAGNSEGSESDGSHDGGIQSGD